MFKPAISLGLRQLGPMLLLTLPGTKSGIRRGDSGGKRRSHGTSFDPICACPSSPESSLVSTCGQRILSPFEHNFASCAQTLGSHHYLGGHTRSEEAAATAHVLQFGSLDKTAVRGRWQSTRTAKLYVDERCRCARIHCVHAGPRASHPIFGGKCGHCTDALSVIAWSLTQGQSELRRSGFLRHSGGRNQVRGFFTSFQISVWSITKNLFQPEFC